MKVGAPLVRSADAVSLTKTLGDLEAQGYEWVFLDLPGRSAPISGAGMVAADMILIPARPADVDIEASIATVRTAKRANKKYA
jgi:cellulose biosynthesis protein BcsQ